LCCPEATTKRVLVDVVGEDLLPVDLHYGDQLAVARLQLRRAVDRDLLELELQLLPQRPHFRERTLTEVAARRMENPDPMDRAPA
jgi:hypothetical protein